MKTFNYFYYSQPIPKNVFIACVPENWENYVANGKDSFSGFSAFEIETEQ